MVDCKTPGYRQKGMHDTSAPKGVVRIPQITSPMAEVLQADPTTYRVPDDSYEPCCMWKNGILVFFYVDGTIFTFRKSRGDVVEDQIREFKSR